MSLTNMIFVNLPVSDVAKATAFYESIGATKNPMFSDETASCIVFSDQIHAMLLSHEKFASFIPGRAIADAKSAVGMLICIAQPSKDAVNAVVDKAATAGGSADATPSQDFGFMFSRSFADPDGHIWEVMWMDPAAVTAGPEAFAEAPAA
ncbi:VOC family protein [Sphingomonas sp.]|uniref:VOC family protein n=1 Tax=Sphingomonas sp. TaxID=28214 RepID=UPI003D6D73CD